MTREKTAKTAIDWPFVRFARSVSTAAATTSAVLIQNAPIRNAHRALICPIRTIQPGSFGVFPVRAGRCDQNRAAARSNSTPSSTWTTHAAVVGELVPEKSYPPKKNTIRRPIPKVDSVQPASQAIAFEGRSEASIRITATIAQGERAHTIASGRSCRKRPPMRRVSST